MRGIKYIAPAVAIFTLAAVQNASAASDPTGIWLNDTGRGAVEIKQCGANLCGNVVWVKAAADAEGCGKQVIGDVAPVGGGTWDNGWIFSPEKNRKYDVELTPLNNGKLKVVGYAGVKFLSKTMIWTRAPQDLQLCGQTEAKAAQPAAPAKADVTTGSLPDQAPAPAAKPAETASAEVAEPTKEEPKADSSDAKTADEPAANEKTASADDENDNGIGKALGNMKLGGLQLDKVLTKTKSGKCQLDTPWLKVQFECQH